MTNEQFQALMIALTDIFNELKKANKRPLYIVVNDERSLRELAKRLSEDRSLDPLQESDKS